MSRFKISTTLENRSFLTTFLGTTNIISSTTPGLSLGGKTGATGRIGVTGSAGSDGGGLTGETISITPAIIVSGSLTLSATPGLTRIDNFNVTPATFSLLLSRPSTSTLVKTLMLSSASSALYIQTGYGTTILRGGDTVTLVYSDTRWRVVSNTGNFAGVDRVGASGLKLIGTGSVDGTGSQGRGVAVSNSGDVLAVSSVEGTGAGSPGAVYVYTRTLSGGYVQQARIVSPDVLDALAISGDGSTIAVGGTNSVSLFFNNGGNWVSQTVPQPGPYHNFGNCVALSNTGNTLVVGDPIEAGNAGAIYVYQRTGSVWGSATKITATGAIGNGRFGFSAGLSGDAGVLVVGAVRDDTNTGAVYVFNLNSGYTQSQKLISTGAIGKAHQGHSVAISSDGSTIAIGGYLDNGGVGAVWIYSRNLVTGLYSQQAKLVANDSVGESNQGWSISLSATGDTLVVGGPKDNNDIGAMWVWTRRNGVWTQFNSKILGAPNIAGQINQGQSVATSDDNSVIVSGAPGEGNIVSGVYSGAIWVFGTSNL